MFFVLSKILAVLLEPLAHPFILLAFGMLARMTKRRKVMKASVCLAVVLPLIYGVLPVSTLPLKYLEDAHPIPDLREKVGDGPIDGIIVLGGHTGSGLVAQTREQAQQGGGAERLTMGLALHRNYPDSVLIFSGRSGELRPKGWTEAEVTKRLLLDLGWPQANIIYENVSRNTYENAVESLKLAVPQPGGHWILVTSASHMSRAVGAFEAAGWPALIPYPVDFQTAVGAGGFFSLRTGMKAMKTWLHEYVGILAYWATGRSSRLFPRHF